MFLLLMSQGLHPTEGGVGEGGGGGDGGRGGGGGRGG